MRKNDTQRIAFSGLLLALMLVLGYVESLIPLNFGVPGIKLGLSNGVLIFAIYMLDIPTAFCLMSLKVLLSGLMFGGVSAIAYAFAGGLLSVTSMVLLSRIRWMNPVVVSVIGGIMHNVGQVALAMLILHTNLLGYLALLMLVGAICGALTGVVANSVMHHLRAIGWKAKKQKSTKQNYAMILMAVIACGVLIFLSIQSLSTPKNTEVTIEISGHTQVVTAENFLS